MTHEKEMVRLSKCEDGTKVWIFMPGNGWKKYSNTAWDKDYKYIVDDEFAKIRMKYIDGIKIQSKVLWSDDCPGLLTKGWRDWEGDPQIIDGSYNGAKEIYREAPVCMFSAGDWVFNNKHNAVFKADEAWTKERPGGNTCKTGCDEDFELWEPKVGEWIIYEIWIDKNTTGYKIMKYVDSMRRHSGLAPLEFTRELMDENKGCCDNCKHSMIKGSNLVCNLTEDIVDPLHWCEEHKGRCAI